MTSTDQSPSAERRQLSEAHKSPRRLTLAVVCLASLAWSAAGVQAQPPAPTPAPSQGQTPAAAPAAPQVQTPADPLGRETPRRAVFGFLAAARKGDDEVARQYLDTTSSGDDARTLAHQLFIVLDARLPARLSRLSDAPEGSRSNPLKPDQEVVGTINGSSGDVEVILERVSAANNAPIWLFSPTTLGAVPVLYDEVTVAWGNVRLPGFLTGVRLGGFRLFDWLAVLLGVPFFYVIAVLLNKVLTPLIRKVSQRFEATSDLFDREVLPMSVRLLILAFAIRWFLASLPTSLLVRQFWSNLASLLIIAGVVWLLISFNGEVERYAKRRFPRSNTAAAATLLRVLRRVFDLLVIFGGMLATLRHFGVDPTPALAGLGVGGIAVALAAQKTLENVIAGASLIFDQAVNVGDALKVGDVQGTVNHIGLRSTRIRTLDRTVVSVPNSQIANMSLETFSARDKFWFHPTVGLRYGTRPQQLHRVVDGIRRLLDGHASIDRQSVRVRFIGLGEFSLDIDIFAYVYAADWNAFLEIQEQLLFGVTDVVEAAGAEIACRSQITTYVANPQLTAALPQPQPRP